MRDLLEPQVRNQLDALGIDYEVLPCDPQLADTAVFCEHYGYLPDDSANTILVTSKSGEKKYVACVVLASTRLDVNRTVRKRMGVRRISFASAYETRSVSGMEIGGVTPFTLPSDVPLWVDSRVALRPWIILGGGNRSCKIRVAPTVFMHTSNTEMVDGLALEPG
ncbi:MAG: hypothetical protein OEQ39_05545 [Gammaproteobacteria bacterium]|nr:hypothetical protein [Gammaproteobacteria bacterium]